MPPPTKDTTATDHFQCSVDVEGYFASRCGETSLVPSCGSLWMKIFISSNHLLWTISRNAHVAYEVQSIIRVTWQSHQLVSLTQPLTHCSAICQRSAHHSQNKYRLRAGKHESEMTKFGCQVSSQSRRRASASAGNKCIDTETFYVI